MSEHHHRFDVYSTTAQAFTCACGDMITPQVLEAYYANYAALSAARYEANSLSERIGKVTEKMLKIIRLARDEGDPVSPSHLELLADELNRDRQ